MSMGNIQHKPRETPRPRQDRHAVTYTATEYSPEPASAGATPGIENAIGRLLPTEKVVTNVQSSMSVKKKYYVHLGPQYDIIVYQSAHQNILQKVSSWLGGRPNEGGDFNEWKCLENIGILEISLGDMLHHQVDAQLRPQQTGMTPCVWVISL